MCHEYTTIVLMRLYRRTFIKPKTILQQGVSLHRQSDVCGSSLHRVVCAAIYHYTWLQQAPLKWLVWLNHGCSENYLCCTTNHHATRKSILYQGHMSCQARSTIRYIFPTFLRRRKMEPKVSVAEKLVLFLTHVLWVECLKSEEL